MSLIAWCAAFILLANMVAEPQEPSVKRTVAGGSILFTRFDRDGDGVLAGDEIPERLRVSLARIDRDQDGKINQQEWESTLARLNARKTGPSTSTESTTKSERSIDLIPEKREAAKNSAPSLIADPEAFFRRLDQNSDGKISEVETPSSLRLLLSSYDQDGNKLISQDEWNAWVSAKSSSSSKSPDASKTKAGTERKDVRPTPNPMVDTMFSRFDRDRDGRVKLSDLPEEIADFGRMLDVNYDGVIERMEASNAMERGRRLLEDQAPRIFVSQFFADDQNADGRVNNTEAKGVLRRDFDLIDGNKDGQISLHEVEKFEKTRVSKDEKVQESRKTAEKRS